MSDQNQKGFTLVELIVVIMIVAILGTLGFISLTGFNVKTRDTKRITDVRTVQTGFSVQQSAGISLPIPDLPTNILSSGSLIALQGYVGTGVTGNIRMSSPPIDSITSQFSIIYTTNERRTQFQLVTFLENSLTRSDVDGIIPIAHAAGIYENRIIKSFGSELGTVLKSDNSPVSGTSYDIILNTSESLKIVLSDTSSVTGTGNALAAVNPRGSCKRIFESGTGKKDGTYTLLVGGVEVPAYCSMTYLDKNFYEHINDGDFEDPNGTNWQNSLKTTLASKGDSKGLRIVGPLEFNANDYTYIDVNKTYKISGKFRSAGSTLSRIYYGFIEYDSNFVHIAPDDVSPIVGTETALTKAVISTDTVVEFADKGSSCTNWANVPSFSTRATIRFDIDDSGQLNDLPNRNKTQRTGFASVIDNGITCTLILNSPAGVNYPVGTKIRAHYPGSNGATYNYVAASYILAPNIWTDYTGTIQGMSFSGIEYTTFRRGTQFIRPLILANYQQGPDSVLEMDDLKLEVLD